MVGKEIHVNTKAVNTKTLLKNVAMERFVTIQVNSTGKITRYLSGHSDINNVKCECEEDVCNNGTCEVDQTDDIHVAKCSCQETWHGKDCSLPSCDNQIVECKNECKNIVRG